MTRSELHSSSVYLGIKNEFRKVKYEVNDTNTSVHQSRPSQMKQKRHPGCPRNNSPQTDTGELQKQEKAGYIPICNAV